MRGFFLEKKMSSGNELPLAVRSGSEDADLGTASETGRVYISLRETLSFLLQFSNYFPALPQ